MEAELADGTILEFPDGTSQEVIQSAVKKHLGVNEMTPKEIAVNVGGALVEPAMALGSGMAGSVVGGLAGLGAHGSRMLGFDTGEPADVVRKTQEAMTYQPRTQGGKAELDWLSTPFKWLAEKGDEAGQSAAEYTGSPAYGAITNAMVQTSPMLLGGIKNPYNKKRVASKMLRDTMKSEGRSPAVIEALKRADPELTAGQAVTPAQAPTVSALFKSSEKHAPSSYRRTGDWQQQSNIRNLEGIAKDPMTRAYMDRIQKGVSDKLYASGREGSLSQQGIANVVKNIDHLIEKSSGNPKFANQLKQYRQGLIDKKGKIITDAETVMSAVEAIRDTIKNKEFGATEYKLNALKKSIIDLSEMTKQGDKFYAQTKRPMNQMNIAQELIDTISPRLNSAERASAYVNAIKNPRTVIKEGTKRRAIGKDIEPYMSKDQMKTIDSVENILKTKADYKTMSAEGMSKMQEVTGNVSDIPRMHLLSTPVVVFNSILKRIEGKTSGGALERIAELGKPKNRAELISIMEKMTKSERKSLIEAYKMKDKAITGAAIVGAEQAGEQ